MKGKDRKERIGKLNVFSRYWTETKESCIFQNKFYRNTNMVSEFKVLFFFFFLLFQISSSRLPQSDTIFFSSLLPVAVSFLRN